MIWRDDDVLWPGSKLSELLTVDDCLQEARQRHTVAIMAATLTEEVAAAIRARRMVPQLHCWNHDDLSVDATARAQLSDAIKKIADMTGKRPKILYPPWNRTSPELEAEAKALGLRVSTAKISLEQFIRFRGSVREDTCNFHYWHEPDRLALIEALKYPHVGRSRLVTS